MAAQRSTSAASRRSPSSSHPSPPPSPTGKAKRSRTKHACDECRRSQKKCDGKALCQRCHLNGTKCVYTPHKSRGQCECGAHKPPEGRDGPVADVYIFPSNTPLPTAPHWPNTSAIPTPRSREATCSPPSHSSSSDEHSDALLLHNTDSKLSSSSHPADYYGTFSEPQHNFGHAQPYATGPAGANAWQSVPTYPYPTSADMASYPDALVNTTFASTPQTPAFDPASDYYSMGVIDQPYPGYYDIYPFQYSDAGHASPVPLASTPTNTSPSPFSQSQDLYMAQEHMSIAPQPLNKFDPEYALAAATAFGTQHEQPSQVRSLHQGQGWTQSPMSSTPSTDPSTLGYWEQ